MAGLLGLLDEADFLLDAVGGPARRRDGNFYRIGQVGLRDFLHLVGHRGREQHGLALFRQQRRDAAQGVDEADVEHLVGLVEHEERRSAPAS